MSITTRNLGIEKRLKIAQANKDVNHVNCAGTAFYILGALEKEIEIDDNNEVAEIIRNKFNEISKPQSYCLVTYETQSIITHLGIVRYNAKTQIYELIHRRGPGSKIRIEENLDEYSEVGEAIIALCELFECEKLERRFFALK